MQTVERIELNGTPLAYIVRSEADADKTTFVTPATFNFQVGFIVYTAGGEIGRHVHRPLERHIRGTSEVLVVRRGRCLLDIYGNDQELELVATRELRAGDVLLLVGGGHGFRMLEDTVFLEIKQGPYTGIEEKERF